MKNPEPKLEPTPSGPATPPAEMEPCAVRRGLLAWWLGLGFRGRIMLIWLGLLLATVLGSVALCAVVAPGTRRVLGLVLACFAVTVPVGVMVSFGLAHWVTRPLRCLARAAGAANAGQAVAWPTVSAEPGDELGELVRKLVQLARTLQEERAARVGDESRLRRTQEVMQRSQTFLNNLVESLPQFIDQKDLAGHYTFVTEYVCRAFGREREELLGLTDGDLFAPAVAQARQARHERVIGERRALEAVERLEFHDGTVRWLKTITMPLSDDGGRLLGTQSVAWDVTELKRAEEALVQAHENLVKASRMAGMAEIATGILHNVGNVLNSVNVSTTLVRDQIKRSRVANLSRVAAMLEEHRDDLGAYLTGDPKGRQLPGYIAGLARHLEDEKSALLREVKELTDSVDHVKQIVAMQQAYAKSGGVLELLSLPDLLEDALRLNAPRLLKAGVEVVRNFQEVPAVMVDRHRTLQILVNLITNAIHAIQDAGRADGRLTLGLAWGGAGRVQLSVADNGKGIAPDHLARVFQHGFTTRKDGHGFGLHSGALAAKEMGGALTVASPGRDRGATFVLELPVAAEDRERAA